MSDDMLDLIVGQPAPDCGVPMRADGTVEDAAVLWDPVRLHVALGVDVSPDQEQAIIDAGSGSGAGPDGSYTDEATRPRLWEWSMLTGAADEWLTLQLRLRPQPIEMRPMKWRLRPCSCCIDLHRKLAGGWLTALRAMPSKGLRARLAVIGRDHRVLMIANVACHNAIAMAWLDLLAGDTSQTHTDGQFGLLHQFVGQPTLTRGDSHRWLIDHGWIETPQQVRLRRRRLRARQRQMRGCDR